MRVLNNDTIAVFQETTQQQSYSETLADSAVAPVFATRQFVTETRDQPIEINPREIQHFSTSWQLAALLIAVFFYAVLNFSQKRFFRNLSASFYSRPIFKQLMRDGQLFPAVNLMVSFLSVSLIYGLLIFQTHQYFLAGRPFTSNIEFEQLGGFVIFAIAFLFAKNLLHFFVGIVFGTLSKTREYLGNSFYFNNVFSILIIPFLAAFLLSQHVLIIFIMLGIALIMWLVKSYRGAFIAFEIERFSRFHFFVYFCALEILPVLVGFNLIVVKGILN